MAILSVTNAVLQGDGVTVRLTTATQSAVQYTLLVENVTDLVGNVVNPDHDTILFNGDALPGLTSVAATTTSNIHVVFTEAMAASGLSTISNYTLSGAGQYAAPITITAATPSSGNTVVDLTFSGEMLNGTNNYTLTVANLHDVPGNDLNSSLDDVAFNGNGSAPIVSSATSTAIDTIVCVFNEPMQTAGMETHGNYTFSGAGQTSAPIVVFEVVRNSSTQVTITTTGEMKTGTNNYILTVANLHDTVGNDINPSANYDTFNGMGVGPQVSSCVATSTTRLLLTFDSQMKEDSALVLTGNYTFTTCPSGATITVNDVNRVNATQVEVLITGEMKTGTNNYTIHVVGPVDLSENSINGSFDSDAFDGWGEAPEVSSATATNNTTIDVVFNEAVNSATANTTANYTITY